MEVDIGFASEQTLTAHCHHQVNNYFYTVGLSQADLIFPLYKIASKVNSLQGGSLVDLN